MTARSWLTIFGLVAVAALALMGCQQQQAGVRPATVFQASGTPTVAPTPTPGGWVVDDVHSICGPLGFMFRLMAIYRLVLTWTPDGTHLVFNYLPAGEIRWRDYTDLTGIWVVDASGSRLKMLVDANPGHASQYGQHADISPDGTQLVYASCEFSRLYQEDGERSDYNYQIAVVPIEGPESRRLTKRAHPHHYAVWSPDGRRIAFLAAPSYAWQPHEAPEGMTLFTMSADGSNVQRVAPPGRYGLTLAPPVWSPDGERLLFQMNTSDFTHGLRDLYAVRTDGTEMTLLADEVVSVPAWSPDGARLAVAKIAGDDVGIFTLAPDGSNPQLITTIFDREALRWDPTYNDTIPIVSWSPDGMQILYSCENGACIIGLESGEVTGLIEDSISVLLAPHAAIWSPDGTRVAIYTSGLDRPQLYTVAPDGSDRRDLIRLDADGNLAPANPPQETQ